MKAIRNGTITPEMVRAHMRAFYLRPKYEEDRSIGDSINGWTVDQKKNLEWRIMTRAKILQKRSRFWKKPLTWEKAVSWAWKEFFTNHPEYGDIRNWARSVTIGENKRLYGEIKPMKHPCHPARANTGNALLIGVYAVTPRGNLITRKHGETKNSYLWTVELGEEFKGQAADWNKMSRGDRELILGCGFCDDCPFGPNQEFIVFEDGVLKFTEDVMYDEERFAKMADLFCEFEELLSIKKEVKLPDGKIIKVPQQRPLIVELSVLDEDVENEFLRYAKKYSF